MVRRPWDAGKDAMAKRQGYRGEEARMPWQGDRGKDRYKLVQP